MCRAVIPARNICLPAGNYTTKNPCFTVCRIDRILHAEMLNTTRVQSSNSCTLCHRRVLCVFNSGLGYNFKISLLLNTLFLAIKSMLLQ